MRGAAFMMIVVCAACGGGAASPDATPSIIDACPRTAVPDGAAGECVAPPSPATGGTFVVFLNFEGATITHGNADDASTDTSFLVQNTFLVGRFLGSRPDRDARIAEIVSLVAETFAPFDVSIVTTRPAAGTYAMVVFGPTAGTFSDIGSYPSEFGMSPFNCGFTKNSIGFVFDTADPEIAHRAAVAAIVGPLGLPQSFTPDDCLCVSDNGVCDPAHPCRTCTLSRATPVDTICGPTTSDEPLRLRNELGCRH
jgi:hypothetical protein